MDTPQRTRAHVAHTTQQARRPSCFEAGGLAVAPTDDGLLTAKGLLIGLAVAGTFWLTCVAAALIVRAAS